MVPRPPSSGDPAPPTLAQLIRQARLAHAWSTQELAEPQFTAGFIVALEQGAVLPSRLTLQYLAHRLGLAPNALQTAAPTLATAADLAAVAEDLRYQASQALTLIRAGQADAGLQLVSAAEEHARPVLADLPAGTRYLIPFVRARAYYEHTELSRAQTELAQALELAAADAEAAATVRNLLGAVFCRLEQPALALREHDYCRVAIGGGVVKDLNLRLSVYRNLALDYWALQDPAQAIGAYHEALAILQDLRDPEREAAVYWGLLMAHRATGEHAPAILYGMRALGIYEAHACDDDAAGVCLNIAEILLEDRRYPEAAQLLQQAKWLARQTEDHGLRSFLYADLADLALQQGALDQATEYAAESIQCAEANCRLRGNAGKQPPEYPARTYAEALQAAAVVEEAKGNTAAADQLFARALAQIAPTAFDETAQAIQLRYAEVLRARGAFEQSVEHYRQLARWRPRSRQGGLS